MRIYKGHLFLTQAVVPHMPTSSSALAISSSATRMTTIPSNSLVYTATKDALEQVSGLFQEQERERVPFLLIGHASLGQGPST